MSRGRRGCAVLVTGVKLTRLLLVFLSVAGGEAAYEILVRTCSPAAIDMYRPSAIIMHAH